MQQQEAVKFRSQAGSAVAGIEPVTHGSMFYVSVFSAERVLSVGRDKRSSDQSVTSYIM